MGVQIYDSSGRLKTNSVTTIDNNQLGHPGFRTDQTTNGFYLGYTSNGNDSGRAHESTIVYQLWYIPYTLTIAQYGINGDDAGNTGTLKIGMYNNDKGLPTNLITGTTGSITGNGTGDSSVAFVSKPTLTAGWYWMASVITSGAIDIEHSYGGGVNNNKAFYSQSLDNYGQDWACYQESGSDLPNSANPNGRAELTYTPRIGIRFDTA
ncbi:MAG: hypothetical protein Tp1124DCM412911_19 [Prokaryotic dsDNA virus sp.]|nr:MAG: hypothetical protein Tp1124DCM412911_19 [Prokaryotic dsDNA virus sp.]|tara:strand:+ start:26786 stop:27409 length:624 start_codon:yes stop_codon:yes gene_type:complete